MTGLQSALVECAQTAVLAASALFIIIYTALARWWKSAIGVTLVVLDGGTLFGQSTNLLPRWAGVGMDTSWLIWLRFASLTAIAGAIAWRAVILTRAQLDGRRKEADP